MSDVNLALVELLHDVHDIVVDNVRSSNGHTEFAREGTLKLLYEGEVVSVEPTGPYYVALVQKVTAKCIRVQYYGTTGIVLADAVFKPCWNDRNSDEIILQWDFPDRNDALQKNFVAYTGEIDLKDVHTVLVARQLEFTKAGKLRFRALRSLAPVHDQLFRFTL
jgi:hypothetical protein